VNEGVDQKDTSDADDGNHNGGRGHGPGAAGRRKVAERVTLGISGAIVLGVAGFLVFEMVRADGPFVAADVRPLVDQARHAHGRYILPVEVRNRGGRTLQDFRGEVTYRVPDGTAERREFRIDFLGEHATQTVYVYSAHDPRGLRVDAQPLDYRVE
jgi:uncharacterized protein (TIGR02588 family)